MRSQTWVLSRRPATLAALLIVLGPTLLLAACGPAPEPETIVQTVVVEKTVVMTMVVVETVVVEKETVTRVPPTGAPDVTPVPLASPTPASLGVVVQQELTKLAAGSIVYNPPAEMTVAKTERIEVRICMDAAAPIVEGLQGPGTPRVESIPVSYFMKVRLVGEDFAISAFSSDEQIVPAEGFSEWAWDVTPTRSGDRSLTIVVTARVKMADAQGEKDLPIIERKIHVKVNPWYSFSSFFRDNRGWIYPAVLVPTLAALGGWFWKRYTIPRNRGDQGSAGDAGSA